MPRGSKIWNKVDPFIFGGGHFAKINMAATTSWLLRTSFLKLIAVTYPNKKSLTFCPPCKYYDPKAPSYNEQCWRSYESTKVRDVGLDFLDRFDIWRTAGQPRLLSSLELYMMTSSNGNIFRVTGPLCGEFTGPGEFPTQRPVTQSFDVFFDLRLNKRLSKQPWGWWFETPSRSLWRHRND